MQFDGLNMADQESDHDIEREMTEYYFHCGYENKVILDFLASHHGISMSLSTLKRRLREYGLR